MFGTCGTCEGSPPCKLSYQLDLFVVLLNLKVEDVLNDVHTLRVLPAVFKFMKLMKFIYSWRIEIAFRLLVPFRIFLDVHFGLAKDASGCEDCNLASRVHVVLCNLHIPTVSISVPSRSNLNEYPLGRSFFKCLTIRKMHSLVQFLLSLISRRLHLATFSVHHLKTI